MRGDCNNLHRSLLLASQKRGEDFHKKRKTNMGELVVLGGDLNAGSYDEVKYLMDATGLVDAFGEEAENKRTCPIWNPRRNLDHVLVSRELEVRNARVIDNPRLSDHCMLMVDVFYR